MLVPCWPRKEFRSLRQVLERTNLDQRSAVTTVRLLRHRFCDCSFLFGDSALGLGWMYGHIQIAKSDLGVVKLFPNLRTLRVQISYEYSYCPTEELEAFSDFLQKTNDESLGIDVSWV